MREAGRPLPPADSPNVLLIVLDTVRADRLSLYGYPRATTPILKRLAKRGIRFDEARATAPWTLASHASMFTGRLPHELNVELEDSRFGPISLRWPNISGLMVMRRRASSPIPSIVPTTPAWTAASLIMKTTSSISSTSVPCGRPCSSSSPGTGFPGWVCGSAESRYQPVLHWFLAPDRKDAGAINREFLDWLSHRQDQRRPFFAFLNYYDAHAPYLPPEGTRFRFGPGPRTVTDFLVLVELWKTHRQAEVEPALYRPDSGLLRQLPRVSGLAAG